MPEIAIIEFDQVSVAIQEKKLLTNISFSLYHGEKTLLVGKSGSGKSTLLKTLLGLYHISAGSINFQGLVLNAKTVHEIRSRIAYIGQEPILAADTVQNALLLPFTFKAHRQNPPTSQQIVTCLERVNLSADILKQSCESLSGGEKQRIAFARSLILGKSIFLLDEISSALDEESKQAVLACLNQAHFTVLAISHDPDWLKHFTKIITLEAGEIKQVAHGNP